MLNLSKHQKRQITIAALLVGVVLTWQWAWGAWEYRGYWSTPMHELEELDVVNASFKAVETRDGFFVLDSSVDTSTGAMPLSAFSYELIGPSDAQEMSYDLARGWLRHIARAKRAQIIENTTAEHRARYRESFFHRGAHSPQSAEEVVEALEQLETRLIRILLSDGSELEILQTNSRDGIFVRHDDRFFQITRLPFEE